MEGVLKHRLLGPANRICVSVVSLAWHSAPTQFPCPLATCTRLPPPRQPQISILRYPMVFIANVNTYFLGLSAACWKSVPWPHNFFQRCPSTLLLEVRPSNQHHHVTWGLVRNAHSWPCLPPRPIDCKSELEQHLEGIQENISDPHNSKLILPMVCGQDIIRILLVIYIFISWNVWTAVVWPKGNRGPLEQCLAQGHMMTVRQNGECHPFPSGERAPAGLKRHSGDT